VCVFVTLLQEGRYLTVGRSERGKTQQDKAQMFADLAVQANSRCEEELGIFARNAVVYVLHCRQ
jgi:hypothetical protein